MLITQIIGNLHTTHHDYSQHEIDYLELEWFELSKRILRKTSCANQELGININETGLSFNDQDILFADEQRVIAIKVLPTQAIAITPSNHYEIARICYELGNRHAPVFCAEHDHSILLVPFDQPMLVLLEKLGVSVQVVHARLVHPLSQKPSNHDHNHSHHHHEH